MLAHWGDQFERARAICQEVLAIATSLSDPLFHARILNDLAVIEGNLGNSEAALAGFQAALAISESIGSYQKSAIFRGPACR